MNIGNEEEIEEIEMVSKYERGSRTLPSNDIQYLRSTIREIYDSTLSFETMDKATKEIVEMLI